MHLTRLNKLEQLAEQQGFAAIALNAGPSLTYLTGLHFHLMERPVVLLIVPGNMPTLVLPELESRKLEDVGDTLRAFTYPEDPSQWGAVFAKALGSLALASDHIGTEPGQLRMLEYLLIRNSVENCSLEDASSCISALRAVKDVGEIALMKKAVAIAQDALQATLPLVKIGASERELANELVLQLFRHGSDSALPFAPIVSSGPNCANPHAVPSERKIAPGDLLLIDWGATFKGYSSDLTRTFAIGEIEQEFKTIYQTVRDANRAGRLAGKPGAPCSAVDNAARSIIEAAGYGPLFTHRTGHGIGMECHEEPYMRNDNMQLLREGMTFTVEPGIYLAGRNGVRIEDDVVITADGAESLSDFPRDLQVLCSS